MPGPRVKADLVAAVVAAGLHTVAVAAAGVAPVDVAAVPAVVAGAVREDINPDLKVN